MHEFGEAEAQKILELGWRQGSSFRVSGELAKQLGFEDDKLVVVVTQSCTVVSSDLAKDPYVEVMVLERSSEAYKATTDHARGKNMRKLTIPLTENGEQAAFVVNINARRFIDRALLLDTAPDGPAGTVETGETIGRWLGYSYSRAALPNNLVSFFRADGFDREVEKVLKAKFEESPLHERVRAMFASWSSEDEVDFYKMRVDFLCDDELVAMELEDRLQKAFGTELPNIAATGRLELQMNVRAAGSTYYTDFDGMRRFSRWDFFSSLSDDSTETA
ncbi:hypothetical protein ACIQUB_01065 [Rhizobium sp. NPDC090275]|uniref:hypothetical protein n=1 Tax=Rhizobium sp. NPDC090275 TaxID=3364498 RepID=UPI000DDF7FAF